MSIQDTDVEVTIRLPRELYHRAETAARAERRDVNEVLEAVVATGLDVRSSVQELLRRTAEASGQTAANAVPAEQVIEELRQTRERIASELYP
jgi:hypothetical protein